MKYGMMTSYFGLMAGIAFAPETGSGTGGGDAAASADDAVDNNATNDAFVADADEGQKDQPGGKDANAAASSDAANGDDTFSDDAEENQDEGSADKAADANGEGDEGDADVPEEYAEFELPEGVTLDDDALGNFAEMARADKLTQEQAQRYVSLYAENLQAAVAATNEANTKAWEDQTAGYSKASREAGLMKPEVLAMANAGIKAADPTGELGAMMKALGINKHQAVIRAFSKYGELTSSDRDVPSSGQGGKSAESLAVSYENAFKA